MHYYNCIAFTMHHVSLCASCSRAAFFILCSITVTSTPPPYTMHHPATLGTKHHTTHSPYNNHVRRTFSNCGDDRLFYFVTIHTLTQDCVCLQTEDNWLGVCQYDDGCCRGFGGRQGSMTRFGGVWLMFAGWCVLNVVRIADHVMFVLIGIL